ncbi:hypothetical protein ACMD2_04867 [Ananas comosus]|uniref:Knr4/Smi1-like domain-containing protein n=1 Tax=Ananas comosus TaxID=4615 RepID=A0A199UMN4_ANACO|nr:hypothetical protein ACMD2_04867 [Ananas comosus]
MVDVDRRMAGLSPAHAAGLRRLSARAAAAASAAPAAASRDGLFSFAGVAESVISHLRACSVPILQGLSDAELGRAEAEFGFSFPPDLRAVLSLGLPSGPGFPDWRSLASIGAALELPVAAASLQVARAALWPRSWGARPAHPDRALRLARAALRRAPLLLPLFDRCYLPCRPSLAGNPVFFVAEDCVLCCALDLSGFFHAESTFLRPVPAPDPKPSHHPSPSMRRSLDAAPGKAPRWIEFWSDAASDRRRRISSSSEASSSCSSSSSSSCSSSPPPPDPERFLEIRPAPRAPEWVGPYLDRIGSFLRDGGWGESDVREMVSASAPGLLDGDDASSSSSSSSSALLDARAALDALLVRADRCSDSLRRAGWSSDDVSDALGLDLRVRPPRPPVKLPPHIALKIQKLVEAVTRS